ncbi:P pilus assembly protein, pilin FimA [Escherichia coli]|uniref:fimbrial protein n=1 Tax=Escherichia coli TaxID=562 RepID=UPI000BE1BF07|nr:hypothetical protein [Escherichia coli]CAD5644496.1 P pilus assembly protein, pilin FimA [Escherichia coli]CAD5881760.1 P pilus assembly protein, pilin FimA [Escherichia coli]CAD6120927.1 P pilus assembly protein, pilin FimA [Escherichia coli]
MNKLALAAVITAAVSVTGSSYAAEHYLGDAQQTISGTIVSSTCTVSFPHDHQFKPISRNAWDQLKVNEGVLTELTGSINLEGCPAGTKFTYSVDAQDKDPNNPYVGIVRGEDNKPINDIVIRLGTTNDGSGTQWDLTGKSLNLGSTDKNGALDIPVYATIVKRGEAPDFTGKFSTLISYTVNYK